MPMPVRTYMGSPPNRGRLKPCPECQFSNEGYAVVRCGGTEVQLSYTLLHDMDIPLFRDPMIDAWRSIICEASLGNTGDDQESLKTMVEKANRPFNQGVDAAIAVIRKHFPARTLLADLEALKR